MTAIDLLNAIQKVGGVVWLEPTTGKIKCRVPNERQDLIEKLRPHKDELTHILAQSFEQSTVWELLQNDWQAITQVCKEAQDKEGLVVILSRDGVTGQVVRLDQPNTLKHSLARLAQAHSSPLEVQLLAVRGDHATLRCRYRKTMLPGWVSA